MNEVIALYLAYVRTTQALALDLGIDAATLTPAIAIQHMNTLAEQYELLTAISAPAVPAAALLAIPPFVGVAVGRQTGNVAPAGRNAGASTARDIVQAGRQARVMGAANRLTANQTRNNAAATLATLATPATDPVNERQLTITANVAAKAATVSAAFLVQSKPVVAAPVTPIVTRKAAKQVAATHLDKSGNVITQVNAVVCVTCGKVTTSATGRCVGCQPVNRGDESGRAAVRMPVAPITGARVATRKVTGKAAGKSAIVAKAAALPVKATNTNTARPAAQPTDAVPGLTRSGAVAVRDTIAAAPVPQRTVTPNPVATLAADTGKYPVSLTMAFVDALRGMATHADRVALLDVIRLVPGGVNDQDAALAFSALMYGKAK
jgi:hypothetical protein